MKYKKLAKKAAQLARETGRPFDECARVLGSLRKQAALAPQLPPSAEAALAEKSRADALAASGSVDGLVAKALQRRANDAVGLELIKATRRNPYNLLGGPRYHL